ncbi:MAG: ISAs1 family transposase [Saprospiraceae bacterium]
MENDQNLVGGLITALRSVEDPRIDRSKLYPLIEILFLTTSAVLSGFEDWDEIVDFGEEKIAWLRKYLPFEQGIPSHDTVNRVISLIDHRVFEECFVNWATMDIELPSGTVISIDGKKLRGSATKKEQQTSHAQGGKSAIHVVHAWCHELQLCLAQYKTDTKSNEITAIPAVLDFLEISGCIITLDAMGCQKAIARKIVDKKGDYIMGLKDNQEALSLAVFQAFSEQAERADAEKELWEVKNHGRKESRLCRVLPAEVLPEWAQWPDWVGLKSVVEIQSKRIILSTGVEENETRYYISSLVADSQAFNRLIRSHWNVENQLHWSLDVIFGEDKSRERVRNAAQNFSTIRKMALNLLKAQTEKISVNRKRNRCALSDQYREKTLGI